MRETNEIPAGRTRDGAEPHRRNLRKFKQSSPTGRSAAHEKNKTEGRALASDWKNFADGRVVSGEQAFKLGFVDELGDFDAAVDRAEKIANIGNANLIEYRERYDISDFLSMFGQSSQAHDIKLDLGLDIPKLQAGALYFLWQAPAN